MSLRECLKINPIESFEKFPRGIGVVLRGQYAKLHMAEENDGNYPGKFQNSLGGIFRYPLSPSFITMAPLNKEKTLWQPVFPTITTTL